MNLLSSPLLSYLAFLLAIIETFTFFLCLYDVANAENGWSFSLYSLIFLSFSLSYIIDFLRVVRLGLQIGNISNVNFKGENEVEEHQRQQLQALDGFLLLVVVLSALSVVVNVSFIGVLAGMRDVSILKKLKKKNKQKNRNLDSCLIVHYCSETTTRDGNKASRCIVTYLLYLKKDCCSLLKCKFK